MKDGQSLETALKNAISDLAPDGLQEIQNETMILLITSKFIPMKKLTYIVGLFSSVMMAIGWTMNILHFPGAGSLATVGVGTLGFMTFVVFFLPLLGITQLRKSVTILPRDRARIISGLLSGYVSIKSPSSST